MIGAVAGYLSPDDDRLGVSGAWGSRTCVVGAVMSPQCSAARDACRIGLPGPSRPFAEALCCGDGGGDRRDRGLRDAGRAMSTSGWRGSAADISLVPGEYAANEGDDRALFAVLEGRIEAVKTVDGIERVVGERLPGDVFGEVPIVARHRLPGRLPRRRRLARAADRAHRLPRDRGRGSDRRQGDRRAREPTGWQGRGGCRGSRPSRRRRGRSWSGSAGIPPARSCATSSTATRSASRGCSPMRRTRPRQWDGPLPGRRRLPGDPLRRRQDGRPAAASPRRRAARARHRASAAEYDTVVIGAGPSGLAAAVYGASEGLRTLVVEREAPGGQAGTSSRIENYLGFPSGVSGDELASRALQQARRLGAEILVTRTITRIDAATRAGAPRRRRRASGAHDHPRLRRLVAAARDRGLRPARRQGHLLRRRPQRGAERARARHPHRRRRQLRRPGGDVLLDPRAQRHDPLPRREPREEHVALPDRPARDPLEHRGALPHARSSPRTARTRSRRSTIRDRRRRRDDPARIRRALHLHRRRRRDRLAAARDRARPARLRAHRPGRERRRSAGRSSATRTCSRRAFPASSRAATCGSGPSSGSPPPSARAAWRSRSSTSTYGTPSVTGRSPSSSSRPGRARPYACSSRFCIAASISAATRGKVAWR